MERQKDIQITANLSSKQLENRLEKFRADIDTMKAENSKIQRYHNVWTKKFIEK
jgi:hypothetical protein